MWSSGGSGGGAVGGMVTGKPGGGEGGCTLPPHMMPSALYRCTCVAVSGGRKGCPI